MGNVEVMQYKRRITPVERLFTRSPFSTVTVVARIQGHVSESMLRQAIAQVRQRHPNLRVRIVEDDDGSPWFTSDGAEEIPVEVVPRESDDHWQTVVEASCRIPFEFAVRPAIRVILVQSPATSELVILCHHILCDGLSLAFVVRDLMEHLGDPSRAVDVLPDLVPIDRDSIPEDVTVNPVVRFMIDRMNRKWEEEKLVFDEEDYRNLSQAYWMRYQHRMSSIELSEAQTLALVERCRREGVTVNSALTTAFVGGQVVVQGEKPYHSRIGVAGNLRDRLRQPAGEVMGFYAGLVQLEFRYKRSHGFWENARRFHRRVLRLYDNKHLFAGLLMWCYLDPTILEAINFKKLGGLVPEGFSRHPKLSAFSGRDDVVLAILKRDKMESLERVIMGTAVTNLTRLAFPKEYGTLALDRLILKPGGAFPLATVPLVLGAVTCAGKLSLVVEYVEGNIDVKTIEAIQATALACLLNA